MKKIGIFCAVLLGMLILVSCSGKEVSKGGTEFDSVQKEDDTKITLPEQEDVEKDTLKKMMTTVEYQMVAAALHNEEVSGRIKDDFGYMYGANKKAYMGDVNGDNYPDMLYGFEGLLFQYNGSRNMDVSFILGSADYYVDKDDNLYCRRYSSAYVDTEIVDGKEIQYGGSCDSFEAYNEENNPLQGKEVFIIDGTTDELEEGKNKLLKVFVNGEDVPRESYEAYVREHGIKQVTSIAMDFTTQECDAKYYHSFTKELHSHLETNYTEYVGMFLEDVDKDGVDETFFVIPGHMDPWFASAREKINSSTIPDIQFAVDSNIDMSKERTAIIMADPDEKQVRIHAYSCFGTVNIDQNDVIEHKDDCLLFGNTLIYAPTGSGEREITCAGIQKHLQSWGYTNSFMKYADLAEAEGEEIVCLCETNGTWNLIVFIQRQGIPLVVYRETLKDMACFIAKHDGKEAMLLYQQSVYQNQQGIYENSYRYNLVRMNSEGFCIELDSQYFSYNENDESAVAASAFFENLNQYMGDIIVISDPFALNGRSWIESELIDYGKPPVQEQEVKKERLGFVEIKNKDSWLHLRTGPGMEYDKVLIDKSDANSFVRQADGSPVTILETIEIDDATNPVWVKIRIRYAGLEIVGYSSKTYIRLADEM